MYMSFITSKVKYIALLFKNSKIYFVYISLWLCLSKGFCKVILKELWD